MSPQQLPSAIRERLPAGVPTSLTGLIGLALLIGTPLGLAAHASDALLSLLAPIIFFGDLFIACLKLLIVPIIVTSLVVGVGAFAEGRAKRALDGVSVRIGRVLHPSPASPAATSARPMRP